MHSQLPMLHPTRKGTRGEALGRPVSHPTWKGTRNETSAVGPAAAVCSPLSVDLTAAPATGMPVATAARQHAVAGLAQRGQSWMLTGQRQQRLLQEPHQQLEQHPQQQQQSGVAQPWWVSEAGHQLSSAANLSDGSGLRFGKCITFQHVGAVSPTSARADTESAPGQAPQHCSLYVALSACTHITLFCGLHHPLWCLMPKESLHEA